MTRSRAFNRFHRFIAKKKRKSLRQEVLSVRDEAKDDVEPNKQIKQMKIKDLQKEALLEFAEPNVG